MVIKSIDIKIINANLYECDLICMNPEFQRTFIFNDLKFLKEPFLKAKIDNKNTLINTVKPGATRHPMPSAILLSATLTKKSWTFPSAFNFLKLKY